MMGGDVGVTSAPGEGSTFWFTAALRRDSGNLPQPALPDRAGVAPGARVLLAEDDEINQEVVLGMLRSAGLVVDLARNGREALEKVEVGSYDLVLMDIQMPEMDGIEATRRIRQCASGKTVPVLALTASGFDADRTACLDAGMNGFLMKPVEPEQLFAELARWLPQLAKAAAGIAGLPNGIAASDGKDATLPAAGNGRLIDMQTGLKFSGGNAPRYRQLLAKFVEMHAADGTKINDALAAGNREEAKRLAHTLKGIGATLGMEALRMQAADLEHGIRDGAMPQGLAHQLAELSSNLAQLAAEIGSTEPVAAANLGTEIPHAPPRDLMARLDAQLATDDFQATDTWVKLRASFALGEHAEAAAALDRQIEAFDFADALQTRQAAAPDRAGQTGAGSVPHHQAYALRACSRSTRPCRTFSSASWRRLCMPERVAASNTSVGRARCCIRARNMASFSRTS